MPLPSNFSNFGKSGGTSALNTRGNNFASTPAPTPPPLRVSPPALRPPDPNADFSNQNKNIPSDCPVEVKTDSATGEQYCPVDQGFPDEQGYDRDQYDNPYDYDGSASEFEANAAAEEAKAEINNTLEITQDIGKSLSMAEAAFSLLNLGNAAFVGIPLANEAKSLNADANALKAGAFNLQSNLNASIGVLNQGIANRNQFQIQAGFDGLAGAQIQASLLQAQGQSIQQRANSLQSRAGSFEQNTQKLQTASQLFGYGAQGANLFSQGYQAATQPSTENYTNFGASLAQTALRAGSDFTSIISPAIAQGASALIGAGQAMSIQAGRGGSPTDIALGFVNIAGGSAYSNVQQGMAALNAGDDARAAGKFTNAFLDVAQIGLTASGVAAPVGMVGIPILRGVTEFGVRLSQGADIETSLVDAADAGFGSSMVGKFLSVGNTFSQAKQGEELWFNAQKPVTGAIRTFEAPLASTTLPRSTQDNPRLGFKYAPSLGAKFRTEGALAQQIQPQGTTFDQATLDIAAARQAAIRAQISGGIAPANFAIE
jgi:hypothetical protein